MFRLVMCVSLMIVGVSAAAAFPDWTGKAAPPAPSGVWIGVRMTEVPEPLAAHLDRKGLMVANVVAGSPADQAGLDRYDVIVEFAGQPVESMEDLVGAIMETGEGKPAEVVLIRGGRETRVSVTPTARPADESFEYKYEEPQVVDDATRYFGHVLKRDPQGNWIFEPLGRLRDMPAPLGEMLEQGGPAWRRWLDDIQLFQRDPLRLWIDVDPDDPSGGMFFFPEIESDSQVDIRIRVDEDGRAMAIHRRPDGTIEVTRTDEQGNESTATYQSVDELQEKDADAYRAYRRFTGYKARRMFTVPPSMGRLQQRQDDWRRELEESLRRLREETRRQVDQTEQPAEGARRQAERLLRRAEQSSEGDRTVTRNVNIEIDDEGRIRLQIDRNGERQSFEFESAEDFRQREPELYEEFREFIERDEVDRSSRSAPAVAVARAA